MVPETHNFALSDVMARGLPVLATGIGAIPERVENRPATWLVPFEDATAECFFGWLRRLFDERLHTQARTMPADHLPPLRQFFYQRDYLAPLGIQNPAELPDGAPPSNLRRSGQGNDRREAAQLGLRLVQDRHERDMKLARMSELLTEKEQMLLETERQLLEIKEQLSTAAAKDLL